MKRLFIYVPQMNDSYSRVVLSGKQYFIRFTYVDTFDYWIFGLYDTKHQALCEGIKIIPNLPLNLFTGCSDMPSGYFGAYSDKEKIGKNDFRDGKASFAYIAEEE